MGFCNYKESVKKKSGVKVGFYPLSGELKKKSLTRKTYYELLSCNFNCYLNLERRLKDTASLIFSNH